MKTLEEEIALLKKMKPRWGDPPSETPVTRSRRMHVRWNAGDCLCGQCESDFWLRVNVPETTIENQRWVDRNGLSHLLNTVERNGIIVSACGIRGWSTTQRAVSSNQWCVACYTMMLASGECTFDGR